MTMIRKIFLLSCVAMMFAAGRAYAQEIVVDSVRYSLSTFDGNEAWVTDYIGNSAEVVIPSSISYEDKSYVVTTIDHGAFRGCRSLEILTLPSSIDRIDSSAFFGTGLKVLNLRASTPPAISPTAVNTTDTYDITVFNKSFYYRGTLNVPSDDAYSKADIWKYFYNNTVQDGIVYWINSSTEKAGVFCPEEGNLEEDIVIPATVTLDGMDYPVTSVIDGAFEGDMDVMKSITLPECLTYIGGEAFFWCEALEKVNMSGVVNIGLQAFSGCKKLVKKTFSIPEGVKFIDAGAFSNSCGILETLFLPSSLQSIGNSAFEGSILKDIYSFAITPPDMVNSFYSNSEDVYEIATLHVLPGCEETYRSAAGWEKFKNIVGDVDLSVSDASVDAGFEVHCADGIVATVVPARIEVYAESGALVLCEDNAMRCDLSPLPGGVYIVRVSAMGQNRVLKVVR